ncbi:histone acetyltransferase KAT6A-like [Daktulosphaira vitifoliae]|uniref:histone acetyltransferase KAT6A-like n=1 Tax=Daktulosphaira vitifoliae TaxID=58002 RepID=UPI0021AA524E|nr:histone acetyltransferase KAT6A-like [Daktulosphaira vitifoliae]
MGVKFFYLVALSFTTLCISCGSSVENDRLSETSSENSEIKSVTSQEVMPESEINKSLLKRFIVPTPDEIGRQLALESLGNENPYYLSKSPQQQQYQQEDRKHANERYGFAPSSPGVFKDQPESYQQLGGNNGVKLSLEATGFTDFVPRQNQFKSPQPSPQYSTGSDSPNSSPFGSSGFDHESPPVSVTYNGNGNSGYLLSNGNSGYSPSNKGPSYSSDHGGPNYSSDHDDSGYSLGGSYDYPKPQQPIIHKSVYVHVAPPDDEPPRRPRVIVSKSPPKKNYQIIFIKAPTPVPPIAPIIVPPPQQEDKTLIYVLHPKQEEPPPIHIPEQPVQKPHKPEVYFIKYKNRHHGDGEHDGDHGHNGNGGYLPEPGSDFGEHSGNYRRYGRDGGEDQLLKSSSTLDNLGSLEQEIRKSSTSSEHRKTEEQEPQATDDENEVSEIGSKNANSSDYYNNDDASVESSNHRETRVLSTKIMPKGKNGH